MDFKRNMVMVCSMLLIFILNGPVYGVQLQDMTIVLPENLNAVGAGFGFSPEYEGADEYEFGVAPAFILKFGNRFLEVAGNYANWNILDHEVFQLGPSLMYRYGREDDIDDDVVRQIHTVDNSVEIGLFSGFVVADKRDARRLWGARMEIQGDISDGHDGFLLHLTARSFWPVSRAVVLGISGGITYASDNYMSSYFGVTATDSASSGLPVFDADAGIKNLFVQPMVLVSLSQNWHIGMGARIKTLISDAKDSPVVDMRGASLQVIGGIGVIYSW